MTIEGHLRREKGSIGGIFVGEKIGEGGMGELHLELEEGARDPVDRFQIYPTAEDTLLL